MTTKCLAQTLLIAGTCYEARGRSSNPQLPLPHVFVRRPDPALCSDLGNLGCIFTPTKTCQTSPNVCTGTFGHIMCCAAISLQKCALSSKLHCFHCSDRICWERGPEDGLRNRDRLSQVLVLIPLPGVHARVKMDTGSVEQDACTFFQDMTHFHFLQLWSSYGCQMVRNCLLCAKAS